MKCERIHSQLREKNIIIEDALKEQSERIVSVYLSVKNYDYLRKNNYLLSPVNSIRIGGQLVGKIFAGIVLHDKIMRQSFDESSLAPIIYNDCIKKNKSIFFAGGTKEDISLFVKKISDKYPLLNIVGYINGYVPDKGIIIEIKKSKPDIVVLGLGNIRQEAFVYKITDICDGDIYTCGAYISQEAKSSEAYYPKWINAYNLRWVYRIYKEKGHFNRLLKTYLRFFVNFPNEIVGDFLYRDG